MAGFIFLVREIFKGRTALRAYMHDALAQRTLVSGTILDVGGGDRQEYLGYMHKIPESHIITVDLKQSPESGRHIDFERDALPFGDGIIDQALCLNVFEHVYNYAFLAGEIARVLRRGGELIGFVPFLINYHPDPRDYFRYTREALERILTDAGFDDVEIIALGKGPYMVNFNTLMPSMPKFVRLCALPVYWMLDVLFVALRPSVAERLPLGYLFVGKKR